MVSRCRRDTGSHEYLAYIKPLKVVSKAKLSPRVTCLSISSNIIRPARIAADSGENGASPAAIKSALMKVGQSASLGRNCRAKVVLPAPFGPAMMMIFLSPVILRSLRSSTAARADHERASASGFAFEAEARSSPALAAVDERRDRSMT